MASLKLSHFVRQFSTTVARKGQIVQAPIQIFGIEGRYAHALYSAATKEKKLDAVEGELKALGSLLKTDAKFADFCNDPSLKRTEKKATIEKISAKLKYSSLTSNLLAVLAENGRIKKINGVVSAFEKLMSAHRGEVQCVVTTAKPLDNASKKEVLTTLQGFLKKGESIQLEMNVDPSLIGGMLVTIGDKYIDMSIASKVKTYTSLIKQAV
ncbi:ATP synthase subunit O, mitochondrial [Patella vulgata]|uniref:ATP synthase subunit O, mitochondrial n=1 Tax=Patella vulgata TaxID=6465 RepID=UPI00217F35A5|nr:ATP synthase subunit O, mitochondrial [Patella vulgata]